MASDIIVPTRTLIPAPRTTDLAILDNTVLDEDEIASTLRYGRASKARNTLRSYASDWRGYTAWAERKGIEPLPCAPGLLCAYLSWCADKGLSASTIERHRAAIGYYHKANGLASPAGHDGVVEHMRGIRRTLGTAPKSKTPLTHDLIGRMIAACPDTMGGVRDRAMIALAFSAALRRSELVALQVEDLTEVPDGFRVLIRRSKTDQAGEGQEIAVPCGYHLRPVELVQMWLARAEISTGFLFRAVNKGGAVTGESLGDDAYVRALKKRAAAAGLDAGIFSGHSLRAGFLTSAAESGADVLKMSEVSRHKSLDVLRRYVRRSNLFKSHAGANFLAWAFCFALALGAMA